jgi:ribose/xylose/arabinose/galactoside ABC-type transport system permease subunit
MTNQPCVLEEPGKTAQIRQKISEMGNNLSLLIALVIICIVFSFLSPYFMSVRNIMNLFLFSSIIAIKCSGLTIAMILGGLDISQNAVGAVTGIMIALISLSAFDVPIWVMLILVIVFGAIMGAINGTLVAIFKINPIITTLGTMQIFRGAAWLINDSTIMIREPFFISLGRGRFLEVIPYSAVIAIVIIFITYYILKFTSFGRKVYMVGGNEHASFLSGINITRVKLSAFIISAITAAIAGFLLSCQVGAALPQSGAGSEMAPIAAVILGGISLSGGKGNISGTILGILILSTINNGLTLLSVNAYYQMVVNGGVLLLAVLVDVIRSGAMKK